MPNKGLQRPTLPAAHLPNDSHFLRHGHCPKVNVHEFRDLVQLRRVVSDAHRGMACGRREVMAGSSGRELVIQSGGRPARLSRTSRLVAGPSDYITPDSGYQKACRSCRFTPDVVTDATYPPCQSRTHPQAVVGRNLKPPPSSIASLSRACSPKGTADCNCVDQHTESGGPLRKLADPREPRRRQCVGNDPPKVFKL